MFPTKKISDVLIWLFFTAMAPAPLPQPVRRGPPGLRVVRESCFDLCVLCDDGHLMTLSQHPTMEGAVKAMGAAQGLEVPLRIIDCCTRQVVAFTGARHGR